MALYEVQRNHGSSVSSLLTTITDEYDRISMHGVRSILVDKQADSLGLPVIKIAVPKDCSHQQYETIMKSETIRLRKEGVSSIIFGDIFLEDLRRYREENLAKVGMKTSFPLWGRNTHELVREFLNLGFKAIVTCIDAKVLDKRFIGRIIDDDFLNELPADIDPCGENGEYHSFVFDGPIFKERIAFSVGEIVLRDSFYFRDLIPE